MMLHSSYQLARKYIDITSNIHSQVNYVVTLVSNNVSCVIFYVENKIAGKIRQKCNNFTNYVLKEIVGNVNSSKWIKLFVLLLARHLAQHVLLLLHCVKVLMFN